jgi:hypothetical protein
VYETSKQLKARLDGIIEEFSPATQKLWDRMLRHRDAGEDFFEDGAHIWLKPAMQRLTPDERALFLEANRVAGLYYHERKREEDQLN